MLFTNYLSNNCNRNVVRVFNIFVVTLAIRVTTPHKAKVISQQNDESRAVVKVSSSRARLVTRVAKHPQQKVLKFIDFQYGSIVRD